MNTALIFGLVAVGGLALWAYFRRPAAAQTQDDILQDAPAVGSGTQDSLTTGAQADATPGITLGDGGINVGSGTFDQGLADRTETASEGLATGETLPAGLHPDTFAINAAAAPLGLVFLRDQANPLTGAPQRVFELASPVSDPQASIGGFTYQGSFIERLPSGAASTAANVIDLGELGGHKAIGEGAGMTLKPGDPGYDEAVAYYRAEILQSREGSVTVKDSSGNVISTTYPVTKSARSGGSSSSKKDSTSSPAGKSSSAASSTGTTTKRTASQVAKSLSDSDPRKKGVVAIAQRSGGGGKSDGKGAGR